MADIYRWDHGSAPVVLIIGEMPVWRCQSGDASQLAHVANQGMSTGVWHFGMYKNSPK